MVCNRNGALAKFPGALPVFPALYGIIIFPLAGFCCAYHQHCITQPWLSAGPGSNAPAHPEEPFAGVRVGLFFPAPSRSTLPFVCPMQPSLPLPPSSRSPQTRQAQAKAGLLWVPCFPAAPEPMLSSLPNKIAGGQLISSRNNNYPLIDTRQASCPLFPCTVWRIQPLWAPRSTDVSSKKTTGWRGSGAMILCQPPAAGARAWLGRGGPIG